MSYDHKQSEQGGGVESSAPSRAPGKTTLTQRLPAIQREADESGDAAHVHDAPAEHADAGDAAADDAFSVAAGGVSGSGGPLPHRDLLEASFGRDLGHVRVHTDSAAQDAASGIGARAYTTGANIAFAKPSPDLHLVAHEAAHVVQQQAGVQLKGGMGQVGDRYEQHADAVADLVVQGKSAKSLLDTMAGDSGGAAAASASASAAPIQRKESDQHLNARKVEARAAVAGIGDNLTTSTKDALVAELVSTLTTRKGADLNTRAKAAADARLAGGSEAENDAKAQMADLITGPVAAAIRTKATEAATDATASVKQQAIAAASQSIDGARPGRVFNTKTASLVSDAKSAAKAAVAAKAAERATAADTAIKEQAFLASLVTLAETAGTGAAGTELGRRNTSNAAVLDLIDTPTKTATAAVHAAIQAYLEGQIGANGTKLFGHKEANKFRQRMKDSAREQAYNDINSIGSDPNRAFTHQSPDQGMQDRLKNAGTAKRDYFVMQGKAQAYDDAKVPVNAYLKDLAHNGTNKILDDAGTRDAIHQKASTDAWDVLRANPASDSKKAAAAKAGKAAANAESARQQAELLAPSGGAFQWQDALLKNQKVETQDDTGTDAELLSGGTTAGAQLQDKVKDEHVGSKALETAVTAPTVGDGLSIIGGLIDLAVPNSGEALKLGIELKIPIPQVPGMFAVLKLEGNAERHQGKDLELMMSFEFGAGWEAMGLSLDARLFLFLKSRGADTDKALKMMSYGVYRDLCSNPVVPEALANFWATGKASAKGVVSQVEDAETWATMIEEYAMDNDDAYAESGWGLAGQGKVKAGSLEAQAKLSGQTMRHWDKKSLGARHGQLDHTGNKAEREQKAREKRKAVSPGERRNQWNLETQAEFEVPGCPVRLGGVLKLQHMWRPAAPGSNKKQHAVDFELGGQLPYDPTNPASSGIISQIAASYAPAALGAIRQIYDRACNANRNDEHQGLKGTGTGLDMATEAFGALDTSGVTGGLMKQLGDIKMVGAQSDYSHEGLAETLGTQSEWSMPSRFVAKDSMQLSFFGKDLGQPSWQLGASLAQIKKMDINVGDRNLGLGVGATFSGEKTKKLFTVSGGGGGGVNNW